jgi:hypothetical protein
MAWKKAGTAPRPAAPGECTTPADHPRRPAGEVVIDLGTEGLRRRKLLATGREDLELT